MQTRITKAKIKDDLLQVSYEEIHPDGVVDLVEKKCDHLVHGDLRSAFDALRPHLAKLCDLREGDVIKKNIENLHEEAFTHIKISSFTISGEGEEAGITISGSKRFGNKVINLNTPFQKWEDEYEPYQFADELSQAVERCIYEVEQYLFHGKHAVKQLEMEFDGDGEDME